MKICVYIFFALCPWIVYVGDWALRWTEGNEQLQIAFVMLLFPLIMNALQYYIIDGFIKNKENGGGKGHHALPTDEEEEDDRAASRPLRNAWDASFDSEDDDDLKTPVPQVTTKEKKVQKGSKGRGTDDVDEYDPDQDGESSGSSKIAEERERGGDQEQRSN